jgi:hypothetical protein
VHQTTRRRIRDQINLLREAPHLPFHDLIGEDCLREALRAEGVRFRDRVYTPRSHSGSSSPRCSARTTPAARPSRA